MISLIRFEDTYGLVDVLMKCNNLDYLDISQIGVNMIPINKTTFIDFGLGSGWANISTEEIMDIITRGVERIIFVYDVDNENGNKQKILSDKALNKYTESIKNKFNKFGYQIDIRFVPVIYAAETIMLSQEIRENGKIHLTDLVHTKDTNKLHLYILAYLLGYENAKRAKKVRTYLDINKLKDGLRIAYKNDLNDILKQWILDDMDPSKNYIMTPWQAIQHRNMVERYFDTYMKISEETGRSLIIKDKDRSKIFYFDKNNN